MKFYTLSYMWTCVILYRLAPSHTNILCVFPLPKKHAICGLRCTEGFFNSSRQNMKSASVQHMFFQNPIFSVFIIWGFRLSMSRLFCGFFCHRLNPPPKKRGTLRKTSISQFSSLTHVTQCLNIQILMLYFNDTVVRSVWDQ